MKYLLLLFGDESSWADMTEEEAGAELAAYERYGEEATKAGVFVAGEGLQPTSTATTMRIAGGERILSDGPFAETKEQLGGFYVLECKDLDEAVEWAAKLPSAQQGGVTEIRPVMDYGPYYDDPQAVEQQGAAS